MIRCLVAWVSIACAGAACQKPRSNEAAGSGAELRIVTLSPSATEIVAALGAADRIVGVDDYSNWPDAVTKLPKVGSFIAPNLETIVRLKPTLVIVDDIHAKSAAALRDAGVTAVECAMHALPDVKAALKTIGARIGKTPEADAAIATIDKALDDAAAKRPAKHPRVLVVIDREKGGLGNIVAAGPGSWADELVAVVGGDNVLAAAGTRYPKISLEEVLRTKPEVILDLSFSARESIAEWDRADVPAITDHRVKAISADPLQHPSPRIGEALDVLAAALK